MASGTQFNGFVMVKQFEVGTTRKGDQFYSLILSDKSGSVNAKIWSNAIKGTVKVTVGAPLYIVADVSEYRKQLQLNIVNYREIDENDNVNISELQMAAPLSPEELRDLIESRISEISDDFYKHIVTNMIRSKINEFYTYPAASSNHHAYYSGLAYHVHLMIKIADAICGISGPYSKVNKDLLVAGIILHDIAKTIELSGPDNTSYTTEGMLIGHINLAVNLIEKEADKLRDKKFWNDECEVKKMKLQHLILSHHGKQEWGSPVVPRLLEAELLHHIDMIDSRVNMIVDGLENTQPGQAEKVYPLGTFLNI